MNTNFIAVTARPRSEHAAIVDLVFGRMAPSIALAGSVQKNKNVAYLNELSAKYRDESNKGFVLACSQIYAYMQDHKTVYLVTHRNCEKWMMEGFKAFFKTIEEACVAMNGGDAASNLK